jgi:hypothetical protein
MVNIALASWLLKDGILLSYLLQLYSKSNPRTARVLLAVLQAIITKAQVYTYIFIFFMFHKALNWRDRLWKTS